MKTADLFKQKTVLSFEVFPPKRNMPVETIYQTIDALAGLAPDFISVTYGAGGSSNNAETIRIASTIKNKHGIESVAHLPGLYLSREETAAILAELRTHNVENVLALRGDVVPGQPPVGDFRYASDVVSFVRGFGGFNVLGACYPEGHIESESTVADLHRLKEKVDAGVDHLVSQLFFDNQCFYRFREKAQIAGIDVPIEAGIMPVVNKAQIERMVSLCGASLPDKFLKMMERYEHSPEAMRDAGIAYAVNQIVDLITQGVDGIHLYTMNNPLIATRIHSAIASLIRAS